MGVKWVGKKFVEAQLIGWRLSAYPLCLAAFQGQAGSLGIQAGRKFTELWECLTCVYSRVR